MVKFSYKSFVSGILIGCLVMIGSVGFATTGKSIKALLNSVTVKIDGKVLNSDRISYNNDVFISSKALASYLGKERKLDKSGNVSLENKVVNKDKQMATELEKLANESLEKFQADNDVTNVKETSGYWNKSKTETLSYKYDIVKTNSVIYPYKGTITYYTKYYSTDFYKDKQEAIDNDDFINVKSSSFNVIYYYKDNKWVFNYN